MVPVIVVPSPQSIVALKSLAVAFGLASVKVATVMPAIAAPSVPLDRRAAGYERCVGIVCLARSASLPAAHVLDGRANCILALLCVGVRTVDSKAAAALRDNRAGRAGSVAPIDGRGEIAGRRIRIGVG